MKKLLMLSMSIAGLAACSSQNAPTTQKLTHDIQAVSSSSVISVIAENNFKIPKNSQIIEKTGEFRTVDNTYDELGDSILIPRDALIIGNYTNDGMHCEVTWKSVYANRQEYEEQHGSFAIADATVPSVCDPIRGIKSGDRLTIKFRQ